MINQQNETETTETAAAGPDVMQMTTVAAHRIAGHVGDLTFDQVKARTDRWPFRYWMTKPPKRLAAAATAAPPWPR
jgi:hypothetical protein